jgi:hypothetical protein
LRPVVEGQTLEEPEERADLGPERPKKVGLEDLMPEDCFAAEFA